MDRGATAPGRRASERGGRLRLRRDAEHERFLLRGRRRTQESEVSDAFLLSTASMGTVVTIHIVGGAASSDRAAQHRAAERALGWFREVERVCSRFQPTSEVSQLSSRVGEAVSASPMLFAATHFALAVAEE